ncbi:Calcium channel yvc1 [Cryptotrichosporon argae]
MGDALAVEEQRSLISATSFAPEPDTVTKLVKRIRALVTKLLPVQVEICDISDATSSIITPEVISAFARCGGDFSQAVPFALLRAKATFMKDAYKAPADYDESVCRAVACEVLARRIVHNLTTESLENVMSTRFRYREADGDISAPISALETAIDQHCTIFLASTESQYVIDSLWRGDWVQRNNDDDDIDYVPYDPHHAGKWWFLDPDRMAVPRYQTAFRIVVWLVFLFVYSQTVHSPVDAVNPEHQLDEWEWLLYIMTFSFLLEEAVKVFKTIRLATKPLSTIGFWTVVNFATDSLLLSAFTLRVIGLSLDPMENKRAQDLQFTSFQVLSCAAPLIWIKLLTVFDGFKVVGVLQVVVFRMLRESAIFFILLAIMAIGFAQSMYALDAADGETGGGEIVVNALLQALLGSPDFDSPNERFGYPFGLIVYYSWNFLATIILVNVLIALFGSAYSDVEENATDEYLAFFGHKCVSLIRAPDTFVYPAPFNLIEAALIAPLEWIVSEKTYIKINRAVMPIIFFLPLTLIAFFEAQISRGKNVYLREYFTGPTPEDDGDPSVEDPEADDDGTLSTVPFAELVKVFPDTAITETATVLRELAKVKEQMAHLEDLLSKLQK